MAPEAPDWIASPLVLNSPGIWERTARLWMANLPRDSAPFVHWSMAEFPDHPVGSTPLLVLPLAGDFVWTDPLSVLWFPEAPVWTVALAPQLKSNAQGPADVAFVETEGVGLGIG